jgi:hypothetical protein
MIIEIKEKMAKEEQKRLDMELEKAAKEIKEFETTLSSKTTDKHIFTEIDDSVGFEMDSFEENEQSQSRTYDETKK